MLEQFEQESVDKEEKEELTRDDIRDQLNEDKPIIYDGKFTKEMFLDFCKELYKEPQRSSRQQLPLYNSKMIESISDEILISIYNNYDILCSSETYELILNRLKRLETKLNTKLE